MTWLMVFPVLIPLAAAVAAFFLQKQERSVTVLSWTASTAGLFVAALLLGNVMSSGPRAVAFGGWPAPFGIVFAADLLASVMVMVTGIIGAAITVFAAADLRSRPSYGRFQALIQVLLAGVNGAFLTGDIFNLYVWFEVMLIASFGLMVLDAGSVRIDGSVKYVVLNLVSTLVFLLAVGILYGATGMLNLAALNSGAAALAPGLRDVLAGLFLFAFSVKAGLFPVFAWLPASYHTLPASLASLFGALLTKVGVYSLIRVFTLVFPLDQTGWQTLLIWIAGLTMLTGVLGAASRFSIRKILSFHIISQVGYMVMGLALYTRLALAGAIFYLVHHIIVKANLFLIGGFLARRSGTDDLKKLGNTAAALPWLGLLFVIPAFSLAGFPPLSGFWGKYVVIRASLLEGQYLLAATALVVGLLTVYSMSKIWNEAFWKPEPSTMQTSAVSRAEGLLYVAPITVLALLTVMIGVGAEPVFRVADQAAQQLLDPTAYIMAVMGARP